MEWARRAPREQLIDGGCGCAAILREWTLMLATVLEEVVERTLEADRLLDVQLVWR